MNIQKVSINAYMPKSGISNRVKSVSFGEVDGYNDYIKPRTNEVSSNNKVSKRDMYMAERERIEDKYRKKRASFSEFADDVGTSNAAYWNYLKFLDTQRECELMELKKIYE